MKITIYISDGTKIKLDDLHMFYRDRNISRGNIISHAIDNLYNENEEKIKNIYKYRSKADIYDRIPEDKK